MLNLAPISSSLVFLSSLSSVQSRWNQNDWFSAIPGALKDLQTERRGFNLRILKDWRQRRGMQIKRGEEAESSGDREKASELKMFILNNILVLLTIVSFGVFTLLGEDLTENDCSQFVGPLLLNQLLKSMQEDEPALMGYIYAFSRSLSPSL